MKVDLNGKVALVTGASRGIGLSIADTLAQNGAFVVYTDISGDACDEAVAGRSGRISLPLDVTDQHQVEGVVAKVAQDYGHLDILVNNAGVNTTHRVNIDQFPNEDWDKILSVDLTGLFYVSRAAVQVMLRQKSGRIINITSVLGLVPARLQCAFIAAKGGVVTLTKAMAIELGSQGILVNAIAPGSTLTEATKGLFYGEDGSFRDSLQQMLDHIPLGRPANVEEIAHAALFLAAPESSYITGHILTVDGGWTAGYIREF